MEQKSATQNYKRQDRSVSPETRQRISSSLKSYNATHPRDEEYRERLSQGVSSYWQQIPKHIGNTQSEEGTTIEDIML